MEQRSATTASPNSQDPATLARIAKTVCMVGTGYVGLVTGACFAEMGNRVFCVDTDSAKIARLRAGALPIYEPDLAELVQRNVADGRLHFTSSYQEGMRDAEFVFIAVNTPPTTDGQADLTYMESAARSIAAFLDHRLIIVNKSTVPIGAGLVVEKLVRQNKASDAFFSVVKQPGFCARVTRSTIACIPTGSSSAAMTQRLVRRRWRSSTSPGLSDRDHRSGHG